MVGVLAGCGAGEADGLPTFDGNVPSVTGSGTQTPNSGAPPPVGTGTDGNGGEGPPLGAPIDPSGAPSGAGGAGSSAPVGAAGSGEQVGAGGSEIVGAAGGAMVGAAGGAMGAAGSAMTPPDMTAVPPGETPPPPAGADPAEVAAFFASLPCGAKYTALGDGGWQFCLRLSDGGAACARGSAEFTRVTFADGSPVTDVAQVSGQRDSQVGVVTLDGALHIGGVTGISTTPLIGSGVINYSGGFHASVALVEEGAGFGIVSWTDNGAPAPVTLPDGAQPIQVSANYGLACALSTAGDVYCWNAGGNHSLQLTDAPTRMNITAPLQMISVGQNSVCGVSFDGTLECQAAWYDSPFLPTEGAAPNFQVRQSTFPSVRDVHVGFGQGIVVRSDGTAAFLAQGAVPPADNPGTAFTGVTDVVASGGDRGSACVQTADGAVFCRAGTGVARATLGGAPLTAQAAPCPR